jgi:hypothetical protein
MYVLGFVLNIPMQLMIVQYNLLSTFLWPSKFCPPLSHCWASTTPMGGPFRHKASTQKRLLNKIIVART